jgi:uncharacterized membrane protein
MDSMAQDQTQSLHSGHGAKGDPTARHTNVGQAERIASAVGGGLLALYGLRQKNAAGALLALAGGALAQRGITGHCQVYGALGMNTAEQGEGGLLEKKHGRAAVLDASKAIKVERAMTINMPADELYRFWRNFENLPRIMDHLESVTVLDSRRSHWKAKAPAGQSVEWDAEIIHEEPNRLISWRSVHEATVPNAGSVHFDESTGDRGTVVRVVLEYQPPAGRLGQLVAKLFGEEPDIQVREDLRRFKAMMEAGEVPNSRASSGSPARSAVRPQEARL